MDLTSPSEVRRMLADFSLSPRKSLGQNFLINPSIPVMIAERAADAADGSPLGVIEIGPGVGALTQRLAERFDRVLAVEIDEGLSEMFKKTFSGFDNVSLVNADFLKTDVPSLIADHFSDILAAGGSVGFCANLPYYITTPVIMKILESFDPCQPLPLSSITVMIQKEVADRLASEPGGENYGSVTASIGLKCSVKKLFDVSPGSFYPAPKVSSTVISLHPHGGIREVFGDTPSDPDECRSFYSNVTAAIAAAFSQRRKTLTNSLSSLYPKSAVSDALGEIGLRNDVRGERLSPRDFCRITYLLNYT